MPALAREMVRRDHDLVLGEARDEGPGQGTDAVWAHGSRWSRTRRTKPSPRHSRSWSTAPGTPSAAFNSACIRTGTHVNGSVLNAKDGDLETAYQGNLKSVYYALRAVVPPLVEQKSGQVVINTSASVMRPQPFIALYTATRAAANALVRATGLEVAAQGVTVNATGTAGMEYPSYLHMVGADKDPAKRKEAEAGFPMKRFIQPEDAASLVATLIDGKATGQTGQFFPIDAGWSIV